MPLNASERAYLVVYCRYHAVAYCPPCQANYHYLELRSDTGRGRRFQLCPRCRLDVTDALRDHLRTCSVVQRAPALDCAACGRTIGALDSTATGDDGGLRHLACWLRPPAEMRAIGATVRHVRAAEPAGSLRRLAHCELTQFRTYRRQMIERRGRASRRGS